MAWLQSLFWKEEMELTLVGLQVNYQEAFRCKTKSLLFQHAGKTSFVNVIASGQFNEVELKFESFITLLVVDRHELTVFYLKSFDMDSA